TNKELRKREYLLPLLFGSSGESVGELGAVCGIEGQVF
ncbi:hypothetical protein LCGC14_0608880, partial [marine sediment metagenome]